MTPTEARELASVAEAQSVEIARKGINGWGNTLGDTAQALRSLADQVEAFEAFAVELFIVNTLTHARDIGTRMQAAIDRARGAT